MARLFDDASSEYLSVAFPDSLGTAFSLAMRFRSDDLTADQALLGVAESGDVTYQAQLYARGAQAGDPVSAYVDGTGGGAYWINTTAGYQANTWHHAALTHAAGAVIVYVDGGAPGSSADDIQLAYSNTLAIGTRAYLPAAYLSGCAAEAAIWAVALSDAEVVTLAAGISPLLVRPESLVFYWPGVRDLIDVVGGKTLTATGTTVADHPRVLRPVQVQVGVPAAAPPASAIAAMMSYYRRRRVA